MYLNLFETSEKLSCQEVYLLMVCVPPVCQKNLRSYRAIILNNHINQTIFERERHQTLTLLSLYFLHLLWALSSLHHLDPVNNAQGLGEIFQFWSWPQDSFDLAPWRVVTMNKAHKPGIQATRCLIFHCNFAYLLVPANKLKIHVRDNVGK